VIDVALQQVVRGVVVARQVDARWRRPQVDAGRRRHRGDSTAARRHGSSYFITSGVWATTAFFSVTSLTVYAVPLVRPSSSSIEMSLLTTGESLGKPLIRLLAASFLSFQNSIVSSVAPVLDRNAV